MIYEAVVATRDVDGTAHFSPMGYRVEHDAVILAPFVPSRTLENLRREQTAVLNFTDDVSIIAGCLTGRNAWPALPAIAVAGWRLANALAHRELRLLRCEEDAARPTFYFATEYEETHLPFKGFNRAQAAVLEAAILLTRLDWLPANKVTKEIAYLRIAVEKTAGPLEKQAWAWVTRAIQDHERHDISGVTGE